MEEKTGTALAEVTVQSKELDSMRQNLEATAAEINKLSENLVALKAETDPLAERTKAIVISDQQSYESAGRTIVEFRNIEKRIKEAIGPAKSAAHKLHKSFTNLENGFLDFVSPHKDAIQKQANDYAEEQRKIREEEERRAAEEQRKAQEKLIAAAQKKIEKLMESGATLQDKREALERALQDPEASEEELFAAQAHLDVVNAQIENNVEKVAAAVERSQTPVVVPHAPATASTQLKGAKTKDEAKITDARALCAALGDPKNGLPIGIVKEFNIVLLNQLVNNGMSIPGVIAKAKTKVSFR